MKNAIIVILVAAVLGLGYVAYVNKPTTSNQPASTDTSSSVAVESNKTSGQEINLSNKGLTSLSKDILDNKSVTKLDVSNNQLTGALPAEIRKLVNLQVLDASSNNMTGIPAEIGQLNKLRVANFANNNISGLPLEIGNLRNLEVLDLRGNPKISKTDLGKIQQSIPSTKVYTD